MNSFERFFQDMGPSNEMTIERENVNGPYSPGNCIWIPSEEQARNKTTSRHINAFGKTMLLIDWAAHLGMSIALLHYHLSRGKTIEKIYLKLHPDSKECQCGKMFIPKREWQIFCSDECKEHARSARRYARAA